MGELAELTPALLFTLRSSGAVEFLNRRWTEVTARPVGELVRDGWRTIVPLEDLPKIRDVWLRSARSGMPFSTELRVRVADGSYRWLQVLAECSRNERGAIARWFGIAFDIDDVRRATRTLQTFADVGESLSGSLGLQATMEAVMENIVPEFADWGFINLSDEDGVLRVAAVYHPDANKNALLAQEVGEVYTRLPGGPAAAEAPRARSPIVYRQASYEDAARVVAPALVDVFWEVGFSSVMVVPLLVGPVVRGTLNLAMFESERAFSSGDVPLFKELARRFAPAIANAELYERERRVAQSFQEAALPAVLPNVASYDFKAIYEAGRAEALIGGDWYDAFVLVDGRVVISIGDVAGSGLQAAVTMSNVRQALRGVAQVHADPALMLEAADRALRAETPERYVTAFVGVIDSIEGTLSYAGAGHPPPLLLAADGCVEELAGGGPPLGLRENVRGGGRLSFLPRDSLLVLYTDGLIESTHDIEEGFERLYAALADPQVANASNPALAIYQSVLLEGSRDDVAILTVRCGAGPRHERWSFDSLDPVAAHEAVLQIRSRLRALGYTEERLVSTELVIAELIGNTVRYAPGPIEVLLEHPGTHAIVHVLDRGPGFEFAAKLPLDPYSESGRGLFLIAALAEDLQVVRRPGGGSHARVVLGGGAGKT